MDKRKQILAWTKEYADTEESFRVLSTKHWDGQRKLETKCRQAMRELIKDENLLGKTVWEIFVNGNNSKPQLVAQDHEDDDPMGPLKKLVGFNGWDIRDIKFRDYPEDEYDTNGDLIEKPDYNGIDLALDSGRFFIRFDDPADIAPFIKEYGLNVVLSKQIDENISYHQNTINGLNGVKELIK